MPAKAIIYVFLLLSGCVMSLRAPLYGVVTYMLVYMTFLDSVWWTSPIRHSGLRTSFLPGLFLIIGSLLNWRKLRPNYLGTTKFEYGIIIFLAICVLSEYVGKGATKESSFEVERLAKCIVFLLLAVRIVYTHNSYTVLKWVWIIGVLFLSYNAMTKGRGWYVGGRLDGVGGPDFKGSSGFGAHVAMALPIIAITFLGSKKKIVKAVAVVTGALAVNALIASQTRGAFIAIAIGFLYGLTSVSKNYRKAVFIWAAIGVVGLTSLANDKFWERMDTIFVEENEEREGSSKGRLEIWTGSFFMLADNPLGVGIRRFEDYIGDYALEHPKRASHNTFILCACELGVQGIIVYLLILWYLYTTLKKIRKTVKEHPEIDNMFDLDAFALTISLIIALFAGCFTERTYTEGYWMLFMMVPCLDQAFRYELHQIQTNSDIVENSL